jgi:hypothetical protein
MEGQHTPMNYESIALYLGRGSSKKRMKVFHSNSSIIRQDKKMNEHTATSNTFILLREEESNSGTENFYAF